MKAAAILLSIVALAGAAPEPKLELKPDTVCTNFGVPSTSPGGALMCYRQLPGGNGTLIQCVSDPVTAALLKIPPCNAFLRK